TSHIDSSRSGFPPAYKRRAKLISILSVSQFWLDAPVQFIVFPPSAIPIFASKSTPLRRFYCTSSLSIRWRVLTRESVILRKGYLSLGSVVLSPLYSRQGHIRPNHLLHERNRS